MTRYYTFHALSPNSPNGRPRMEATERPVSMPEAIDEAKALFHVWKVKSVRILYGGITMGIIVSEGGELVVKGWT